MKSLIRPAEKADVDALYTFVLGYKDRYPRLRLHTNHGYDMLETMVTVGRHYTMLSTVEDRIAGALLAATTDHIWAEGMGSQILFWVSRVPGDGRILLRRYRQWVMGRRTTICVAGFCPDLVMDPRAWQLAERVGFERRGGSYLHYN